MTCLWTGGKGKIKIKSRGEMKDDTQTFSMGTWKDSTSIC